MENIIKLPPPVVKGGVSLEEAINKRRSVRRYTHRLLSIEDLSQVLWAAGGLRVDAVSGASRTFPSAGACYPLEFYAVIGEVERVPSGLYHYIPQTHSLEKIIDKDLREYLAAAAYGQSMVKKAPLTVVITAEYERSTSRYGKRGEIRYVHMDAGHSGENVYLMAAARGLGTVAVGAFNDSGVKQVLELPKNEKPLYLFPIGYPQ